MKEVVVVSAVRTPVGRDGGALRDVSAEDLATLVMREAVRRAGIDPSLIEDVIFGHAIQAGPVTNIARVALLKAGFPESVPGMTVDRRCASGLQAVNLAAQAIMVGDAEILLAGGVENMTRSPYIMDKLAAPYKRGALSLYDSFGGTKSSPVSRYGDITMGKTAEKVAERYGISREDQDQFALRSHQRAVAAIREGRFEDEIVPVTIPQKKGDPIVVDTDEHPRPDTSLEKLAKLSPAFKEGGTVTAGNASGINDGAAALVLMSRERAQQVGLQPLAAIKASAAAAVDPWVMGIGPVFAIPKALKKTGLEIQDIDLFEINEAFASQLLACVRELGLDLERVNVNGGAIALGHPLGCTGAKILTTLIYELRRRRARYGVASLCVGGGQGVATVVEHLG